MQYFVSPTLDFVLGRFSLTEPSRFHNRRQQWWLTFSCVDGQQLLHRELLFIRAHQRSQYSNRRVWSVRFLPLLSNVNYWVKTPRNVSAAEQLPWTFTSALNKTESLVEVRKKKRILEIKCLSYQSQMEDLYSLLIKNESSMLTAVYHSNDKKSMLLIIHFSTLQKSC